jgi:hypothetical protein
MPIDPYDPKMKESLSYPNEESKAEIEPIIAGVKHRRRLAEPEPELSSLSQREQRAILREKMGLLLY